MLEGAAPGLALLSALVVASGLPTEATRVSGAEEVVVVTDPRIVESSGLLVRPRELLTVNDSGDAGLVYVVDRETGRTIGRTSWSDAPVDVEALAPAEGSEVWIGDIGDNLERRPWISVTRVLVRRGDRTAAGTTYRLRYPDGPRDAEALLRHPRSGRLLVVTKGMLEGGEVYAAPRVLRSGVVNRLRRLGLVGPLVTDGAFLADGRTLVLRDYVRASIYSYPRLRRLAVVDLPEQPQGEGLAVAAGSLFLSSEGRRQPILRVGLPDLRPAAEPREPQPGEPEPSDPQPVPADADEPDPATDEVQTVRVVRRVVGALIATTVLVLLGRRLLRRRRSGR